MTIQVDNLMITNVSQFKSDFYINTIEIRFEIDRFQYALNVSENDNGVFYPWVIDHVEGRRCCQYCNNHYAVCFGLRDYSEELFHRLIEFPSIRLKWLYINHV